MEWYWILLFILGGLILLLATGMPIAFCFIVICLIAAPLTWSGKAGIQQVIVSLSSSVVSFTMLPLPLFVLMGAVIFHSKLAPLMIDALDKWIGHIRGRLSLLAVGSGVLLSTLTGSSVGSVAMLGGTLVPEMERRGYRKPMTLGPILGSGGLAAMIPPSNLAVLVGAIGEISIGGILVAIIFAGLLMGTLYALYIVIRCKMQPSLAPAYEVGHVPASEKIISTVKYILPLGFVIFMVVGVIFFGIATATEAAATGALSTFILTAFYGRLSWGMLKNALVETLKTSTMLLMILAASQVFSQILSFSGAALGMAEFASSLKIAPILILMGMMVIVLFLGMFMDAISIMMVTLPIFMPVVLSLGYDPVWFAVLFLINIEMAMTTPPVGFCLYTMKSVGPPGTTLGDVCKAALPFLGCDLISLVLIMAFPKIVLWLPSVMH